MVRVSGQDPRHVTLSRGTAEDDVSKKVGIIIFPCPERRHLIN